VTTPNRELPRAGLITALTGDERQVLEATLDYYRAVITRKIAGVAEADLGRRLLPSATTLGGLLKHLAAVERRWFRGALGGEVEFLARDGESNWVLQPDDTIERVQSEYDRACSESRELAAGLDLADPRPDQKYGPVTLRFVYVHMIDETARHAGHADILRELIDGSTGDD
jgi:uncharacterized damage-inducible protein DinB